MDRCPECGAELESGRVCLDYFHDMLGLEWLVPNGPGDVTHFLAVASYNLQHPSRFVPSVLVGLRQTLGDVLAARATIAEARGRARNATDGSTRVLRREGEADTQMPNWPSRWSMTVRHVCHVQPEEYTGRVWAWAATVNAELAG